MKLQENTLAVAALTLGALAAFPATPAVAGGASAEIRALRAELKRLEAKVANEHRSNVANQAHTNVANLKGPAPVGPPPVFISFNNGVFVETEDHAYNFKFGGRLHLDAGVVSQPLNIFESGNTGIRRARFDWSGRAANIWTYAFQYDFASGAGLGAPRSGIRDAWLGLRHPGLKIPYATEPVLIQVGQVYEPFSLEALNSANNLDFIERPIAVDAFSPFRHIGTTAIAHGTNWTVKGGVFSTSYQTDGGLAPAFNTPATFGAPAVGRVATGGGQYYDITGRLTYAPILDDHNLLHFGVSGRYHRPNDATGANDVVLTPGSRAQGEANTLARSAYLATPDLSCGAFTPLGSAPAVVAGKCVSDVLQYDLELAAAYGPVSIQAEYLGAQYNRDGNQILQANIRGNFAPGGTSQYFDGWYVSTNWWVTGEERARSYNVKDTQGATIGAPKIKAPLSAGGLGAIGLVARYDAVNLNSGPFAGSNLANLLTFTSGSTRNVIANAGVAGGRQENVTAGIQWYPDNGIHFSAHWTHVLRLDAPYSVAAFGALPTNNLLTGAHPDIFEVRTTVYW